MKATMLILMIGAAALIPNAFGAIIYQTGFDSSEGWQHGFVTNTPGNPPTGNWYSSTRGDDNNPARIEIDSYSLFTPYAGDGMLVSDRRPSSEEAGYGRVDINLGEGHLWEITAWQIASTNSGTFASIVVANTGVHNIPGTGNWLAGVAVSMLGANARGVYWGDGAWVYPSVGDPLYNAVPLDDGQPVWARFRLLLDTEENTYSAYVMPEGGTELTMVADKPFYYTSGTNTPLQVSFGLGAPDCSGAWDDLSIYRIPEPGTMSILAAGLLLLGLHLNHRRRFTQPR